MAGTLRFKVDGLRPVVEAAERKGEGVLLVKDQGVYIMAAGTGGADVVLAYAEGLDPKKAEFDDWWHEASRICGGDDFGEELDPRFLRKVVDSGARELRVKMSASHMTMEAGG